MYGSNLNSASSNSARACDLLSKHSLPESPRSEVEREMTSLMNGIGQLEGLVAEMAQRLIPVLAADQPDSHNGPIAAPASPLAQQIQACDMRCSAAADQIRSLLWRLAI